MAVRRPTFHESWYRVADLSPRLLSSVHVYRQRFRGELWYVLENPATNEYARLGEMSYAFVALLDGNRTVAEAWHICNEQMMDAAPTQGEVIQLLGQLYTANLLYGDLPADTESLFNRYRTRLRRKVQFFFTNFLFVRIPLYDPDRFLDRCVGIVGKIFSRAGLIVWLAILCIGMFYVFSNINELVYQSRDVLSPANLMWLYVSLILIKVCHEFSHAFACKRFGRLSGSGGQVHTMGITFLVFVPLPYVDASSAWAFRNKWHRVVVGAAGMMAELFIAALAAIFWASTSAGVAHRIAYNVIFIAGISTLLFNGNPLLRFDAYYILCDLIEIPNLGERSKQYIYYLIRQKYWGVKHLTDPSNSEKEARWLVFYGIASTVYRVYISVRILLFLSNRLPEELFFIVPAIAISAVLLWAIVPLAKFIRYLASSPELARNRPRAVWSTALVSLAAVVVFGIIPLPYHIRVEGVVEPVELSIVHAEADGIVHGLLDAVVEVTPDGPELIDAENRDLRAEQAAAEADKRGIEARWRLALTQEPAAAQVFDKQLKAIDQKLERIDYQVASLAMRSPLAGTWVPTDLASKKDVYVARGEKLGLVGTLDNVRIRAAAGQAVAAILIDNPSRGVEIRVKNRPHRPIPAVVEKIIPAGSDILPSQALGYAVGGSTPTEAGDQYGVRAAENIFEVRIIPQQDSHIRLLCGQRVVARIALPARPLAIQWWNGLRQLLQRRFRI